MMSISLRTLAFAACTALALHTVPSASAQTPSGDSSTVQTITPPATDAPHPAVRKHKRRKAAATPAVVSPDDVHPITSLPKPPGAEADAAPSPATPAQPEAASPTLSQLPAPATAPAPLATTPVSDDASSSSADVAGPAPVPEGVKTPPAPPMPEPAPADMGPEPIHAGLSVRPEVAAAQALPAGPAHVRPFSAVGVQLKVGFAGPGIDIAVPLSQHWNARVGGSFFQYSGTYTIDGINIAGEVKFRSGTFALDYFPFKGTFRVSPGVTFYNGNNINASAQIPAGQTFTLNDVDYTSAPNDPVRGSASMTFGKREAPSLTIGWGNMIPRHGSRFSVPFEIGAQYIDDPKISLYLAGTACSAQGTVSGCGQLQSDPIAQDNLAREQKKLNDDINPLRFYPIVSIGVSWSFGPRAH